MITNETFHIGLNDSKKTLPKVHTAHEKDQKNPKRTTLLLQNRETNGAAPIPFNLCSLEYSLETFHRSNQDTCLVHRPAVFEGDWVQSGDLLADCAASVGGELSLGHNILVAYMPWEGYNYEDAILLSERLVFDDVYTSIHIERYEISIRDTKTGVEEITREIPDLSQTEFEKLDKNGLVKLGTWVEEGDILVGKITPITKKSLSNYQNLLNKILKKEFKPVKDSSLRAPKGLNAKVIKIQILNYTKNNSFPLSMSSKHTRNKNKNKLSKTGNHRNSPNPVSRKQTLRDPGLYSLYLPSPSGKVGIRNVNQRSRAKPYPFVEGKSYEVLTKSLQSTRREYEVKKGEGKNYRRVSKSLKAFRTQMLQQQTISLYALEDGLKNHDRYNSAKQYKKKFFKTAFAGSLTPTLSKPKLNSIFLKNKALFRGVDAYSNALFTFKMSQNRKRLTTLNSNHLFPKALNIKKCQKLSFLSQNPFFLKKNVIHKQLTKKIPTEVHIYLAEKRKIQVGDKIAGRHGNKGIISQIFPREDMPFLPDGSSLDIVLNPLGVPSRMNVGQIYECLLGLAGKYLGEQYKIFPFDEIYGADASRSFVYSKLYEAREKTGFDWLFNPSSPGKMRIYDGRTGETFNQPVTVGRAYVLKLVHMVDDKIHARSTGPYSLVTQQPLRGRAKTGGQRLGEMEVWAIEGYGAAFTLLEMLTIKSDDMRGRISLWSSIIYNKEISIGTPEAFNVLIRELQALCLDIGLF